LWTEQTAPQIQRPSPWTNSLELDPDWKNHQLNAKADARLQERNGQSCWRRMALPLDRKKVTTGLLCGL
jgi:hypothetical protein